MKKISSAIALFIGLLSAIAQAQTSGYTGTWTRNDSQTDPGGLSINTAPAKLEISGDQKTLYIKATLKNAAGQEHIATDTLNLDGSKRTVITPSKRKRQSGLTLSAGPQFLSSILSITDAEGTTIQEWKQTYRLANNGKTLRVSLDLNDEGESYHLEEVFDKQ